ncbi:flagellar hook basal-body protein [bacterium]|nr:flagellar hook basal-body protein [bacterium]
MTTLSGIINKGIMNSEIQYKKMAYVAANAANYNTYGYRTIRFEQILDENGVLTGVERTDFTPGSLQRTARDLDVAIDGVGFIPVTGPNGEVTYTRDGMFKINKDGYIVTNDDYLVGDGIQVPTNYNNLEINDDGVVEVFNDDGSDREVLGQIPLVNFLNPEGLKRGDNNKYYLTAESGEPVLLKKHGRFKQGSIEMTNLDLRNEVNTMLRLNASMLASFKIMQTINDMYQKTIRLAQ